MATNSPFESKSTEPRQRGRGKGSGACRNIMLALTIFATMALPAAAAQAPAASDMAVAPLRAGIRQVDPGSIDMTVDRGSVVKPQPALAIPGATLDTTCLEKSFPVSVSGAGGVTWHVCVTDMGKKALWVGPVYMKRSPTSPWVTVLYQAGLADIFVPYHGGIFRPYDLRFTSALSVVTQQDAGNNGSPISLAKGKPPTVVAEVRERGIAWLCKRGSINESRRGEEFVVWAVSDAGNYDNIIQFSFRDDGSMAFRAGHTGYNAANRLTEAHMHTSLWRVDMDLNGAGGDSAQVQMHREPVSQDLRQAADTEMPYNGGREGSLRWNPLQRTTVLVEDNATNPGGTHRMAYEFVHVSSGTARHYAPGEQWSQYDFHVTRFHPNELDWLTSGVNPSGYLPAHLADQESVQNQDIIVWMQTSAHHEPTDEDNSADGGRGVTLVHWSGFNIEPHNLFAANPLGGPPACGE